MRPDTLLFPPTGPARTGTPLRRATLAAALATALAAAAGPAAADELRMLAPNAVREPVLAAVAAFERSTGHRVELVWTGTEAITRRVGEGEPADVVVNAAAALDRLVSTAHLVGASRVDFARSGIAAAVPATAPAADIGTPDALKAAVLAAPRVVLSSGTSGRHMQQVFERLGIAAQVQARLQQPPSGAQIAETLARGEADLGFQQVSELRHAPGVRYLGPLPASLQQFTVYGAALHVQATRPDVARQLLATLRGPEAAQAVRAAGMNPP